MTDRFSVLVQSFDDLSLMEQEDASNNGRGKEYAAYIRVIHDGNTLFLENDAIEPEDATFLRDLGWIKAAIEEAYKLGRSDD